MAVGGLALAGVALGPTFVAPHDSVVLEPNTAERAEQVIEALGAIRSNPHDVRRKP